MISTAGAALIATVYPIGILILVFEARSIIARIIKPYPPVLRGVCASALILVVAAAALATALCVVAVSSNVALDGGTVVFLSVTGSALYGVAILVFTIALLDIGFE